MSNPLFDTLFRPTTPEATGSAQPAGPAPVRVASVEATSAAPVRVRGTRTRAGNAMNRTRRALLGGAALVVAADGTKITMAAVAVAAGVAKATLYNHFRTREAVLAALVVDQVAALVAAQDGKALETALADTARAISTHPVCRGLARVEPAALAQLGRVDASAEGWQQARTGVQQALEQAGRGGADTVLRWLASYLLSPADDTSIAADVAVLVAGLPTASA